MARASLQRTIGLPGAVGLGLGSIIGTGVFVGIGVAAGASGPAVIPAILLAALLALANALSSAQLAAAYPVSGGTYEYGCRLLHPAAGFTAGWMFLCAKSASAAAAALGASGYLLTMAGVPHLWQRPLAAAIALLLTFIVLGGLRRSNFANTIIIAVTLSALLLFVALGVPSALAHHGAEPQAAAFAWPSFFEATALMFVAYTGYGRIATLGEEVQNPRRVIPRAIGWTLGISAALYLSVALVAVGGAGAEVLAETTERYAAPLEKIAESWTSSPLTRLIGLGAITAMLGVLLNLILGLSRVVLAMGRRGDLPAATARINAAGTTPVAAVLLVGLVITLLAGLGSLKVAWSFSAFTVLIYYAITNLCALRLSSGQRLYPRWIAFAGFTGCLLLSIWIEAAIALGGIGLLAAGLLVRAAGRRLGDRGRRA